MAEAPGYKLSDQTVGNILGRHDIPPAPKRKHTTSWKDFIRTHLEVLVGTDFFAVEVFTLKGLVTYYVLFFIHLESRKVCLAGMTPHPHEEWMKQMARNATLEGWGFLANCRYLLHDRDGKFCSAFDRIIELGNVTPIRLPARSPNLNAFSERWVKSVKEECLAKLILFGESSLRPVLQAYELHYHEERNHQGKGNRLLFPSQARLVGGDQGSVQCQERLGGLLKYYYRRAG
jgi:integrase-like protein